MAFIAVSLKVLNHLIQFIISQELLLQYFPQLLPSKHNLEGM